MYQGRPSVITPEYAGLLQLQNVFPKSAKLLKIYGGIDDRYHSDGQVTTTSAKSYWYLAYRAASYSEYKVTENGARHSQLHENGNVDAKIITFFVGKNCLFGY
ncbi:alpha/beta hydrolase [Lactiplantibacillus plantarum]|uniref:alpha/beta hydrolase n=1 Tax=Lactiplantibacillus plantarum TaxID=1590 RepID=UPI0021C9428A|nr:alpha/beta hydrolase [Lactiplantibacillus plantarum]